MVPTQLADLFGEESKAFVVAHTLVRLVQQRVERLLSALVERRVRRHRKRRDIPALSALTVCVRVYVRACVRACVRAVCARVYLCVRVNVRHSATVCASTC